MHIRVCQWQCRTRRARMVGNVESSDPCNEQVYRWSVSDDASGETTASAHDVVGSTPVCKHHGDEEGVHHVVGDGKGQLRQKPDGRIGFLTIVSGKSVPECWNKYEILFHQFVHDFGHVLGVDRRFMRRSSVFRCWICSPKASRNIDCRWTGQIILARICDK